jgi:hypothetical protein
MVYTIEQEIGIGRLTYYGSYSSSSDSLARVIVIVAIAHAFSAHNEIPLLDFVRKARIYSNHRIFT